MDTIGIIELNSIARGMEVTDSLLKAADVSLLKASTICPGKYMVIVKGVVAAVKSAVQTGIEIGKENVVESKVISRLDSRVINAVNAATEIQNLKSLGVLEFFDVTSALYAADSAIKASAVEIIEIRMGYAIGGKSFVTLTGDLSAVKTAIEVGSKVGNENCMLVNKAVIASPSKELLESLL
ncbi:BMC domain-containing protein [Ilyobacter sp.]|uniref:BMC domain-containing protein n=1 Tax=Ilyobacter sp. TaxID=3100343 RepID=UPI003565D670